MISLTGDILRISEFPNYGVVWVLEDVLDNG